MRPSVVCVGGCLALIHATLLSWFTFLCFFLWAFVYFRALIFAKTSSTSGLSLRCPPQGSCRRLWGSCLWGHCAWSQRNNMVLFHAGFLAVDPWVTQLSIARVTQDVQAEWLELRRLQEVSFHWFPPGTSRSSQKDAWKFSREQWLLLVCLGHPALGSSPVWSGVSGFVSIVAVRATFANDKTAVAIENSRSVTTPCLRMYHLSP